MVVTAATGSRLFSDDFYARLVDASEGERIRACLQCGMCSGVCPLGFAMDYPPGKMVAALRAHVFADVLETDTVWMCVSCYACTQVCPAKIPLTAGLMARAKEEMVLGGHVPAELQLALENSHRYGNPLGQSPRRRVEWTRAAEAPVPVMGKETRSADVLWFVGDYASYHPRVQRVSLALAKILHRLNVDFAILGPDEVSDGDSQRLAGERGLFELLAARNGQALRRYHFGEIVTTDPHAYNALKNEYPALGIDYPVRHCTQFLASRLEQLRPQLTERVPAKVTYHDPCYLGRANDVYDEPRALLEAIPGVELVEMAHSRASSLCCGGGGGGMWMDGFLWEKTRARTSEWRVQEAVAAGASVLAVACPYEPPRFEDAAKSVRGAGQLAVLDVAELLAQSLGS